MSCSDQRLAGALSVLMGVFPVGSPANDLRLDKALCVSVSKLRSGAVRGYPFHVACPKRISSVTQSRTDMRQAAQFLARQKLQCLLL
eukprot:3440186-Amphidinium_carterae.2